MDEEMKELEDKIIKYLESPKVQQLLKDMDYIKKLNIVLNINKIIKDCKTYESKGAKEIPPGWYIEIDDLIKFIVEYKKEIIE